MHGPVTAFFQVATNSCTQGHSRKLIKAHCRTDTRLNFFSHRVLNRWNSLSQDSVDVCSVNAYKRQLDKIQDEFRYGLVVRITLLAAAQARV